MNSVPNRAGAHRALAHDYSMMSNEQLKAVHAQAVNNAHIEKYGARVEPARAEMARRAQLEQQRNQGPMTPYHPGPLKNQRIPNFNAPALKPKRSEGPTSIR